METQQRPGKTANDPIYFCYSEFGAKVRKFRFSLQNLRRRKIPSAIKWKPGNHPKRQYGNQALLCRHFLCQKSVITADLHYS